MHESLLPNNSFGRYIAIHTKASWGTSASNIQPLAANVVSSNGSSKHKADTCTTTTATLSFSSSIVSPSSHAVEILKNENEENKMQHPEYATLTINNHLVTTTLSFLQCPLCLMQLIRSM
ncbi:uncharacterized protein LOC111921317 [Lactuca sativa]|uniref:uncharacterized protein LOC111921317 n=1 Tax=Lactuca sativa TaxID=4236 RepID=UPI0022AF45DA|nr:uncharacterized protein LOC111921317 [Lactuca sativa]